jgi:glycosyltransferase involved in cell wall biosynthesis
MAKPVKKVLVVTHDAGNYGASRSLQLLVNHWDDAMIDLIVARRLLGGFPMCDIRRRFHTNVRRILKFHLPLDYCYRGKPGPPVVLRLYRRVLQVLWRANEARFARIVQEGGYDLVHFNSLVLHELISDRYPCTVHIREIFDGSSSSAIRSLQKARGVIFIDEATRQSFSGVPLPPSVVLNNPIDMTPLSSYSPADAARPDLDPGVHTVFAVIGRITSDKGTDFIIRSFRKVRADHARLVVVGGGDRSFVARTRRAASGDRRIIFWGEEPDILKIYRVSDYILRGEPYPCIGRTVYEGLYAGAHVIIPGTPDTFHGLFERDRFTDRVHLYAPRDEQELTATLQVCAGTKPRSRAFSSNVEEHVRWFREFVGSVLSG